MGKGSRNTGSREERNLVAYPFTAGVVYHEGWGSVSRDVGAGCMRVPMIILAAVYFAFSDPPQRWGPSPMVARFPSVSS